MDKKIAFCVSLFVWIGMPLLSCAGENWISLFNGQDLTGWTPMRDVTFDVQDGNLRLVSGMGWLRSDQRYGDFVLEFECKPLVENYDSGIFFQAGLEGDPWPDEGLQVNLKQDAMGTLVRGRRPLIKTDLEPIPVGQWMKVRLFCQGENAKLEIDGKPVWEADFIEPASGLIGIQAENRSFEFRNIRIQDLGYTNLLGGSGHEFETLAVQAGDPNAWSLKDGVLVCEGKGGGWIGTRSGDYGNFDLKLDFNVPKEGNSGVYIRCPKNGDGAYAGMEIQVIDDDATHWGTLQPWQHCGSIYHEVAPSVRATHAAETWQTLQITAIKNQIDIFINGIPIIDCNLDEHPKSSTEASALKDRSRSGFIGFQNYDGHIQYRNVRVKRIPE